MTTALVSLLTDTPVRPTVGMTGEVTLQGRVLPIGGLKQKVLAAHRAGLTEVILPKRNEGDLDDVPEQVREQMTFHIAEDVADVLAIALQGRRDAELARGRIGPGGSACITYTGTRRVDASTQRRPRGEGRLTLPLGASGRSSHTTPRGIGLSQRTAEVRRTRAVPTTTDHICLGNRPSPSWACRGPSPRS